jgi:hypothetical protein
VALSSYQAWNQNQFLLIAIQGDQMSLWKNRPQCSQRD